MKKIVLKVTLVVAFALVAGLNVYNAQKEDVMSDLALANVEALAGDEYHINPDCRNGCVDGRTGCWCFQSYPDLAEARWH